MNLSLKHLAATTLILASLSSFTSLASANITAQQSAVIFNTFNDTSVKDFRQFLTSLSDTEGVKTADFAPAITAFLDNKTLSEAQRNDIHRLLGLYTRLKYGSAATETLRELVAIQPRASTAWLSTKTPNSSRSPTRSKPLPNASI